MKVRPVILCGGSGTRLWPVSRRLLPKQLISLTAAETMLQATALRTNSADFSAPVLLTSEEHRFLVQEQLEQIGISPELVLLEPLSRNTAPAIALAALTAASEDPDELLLVMPSDHIIGDAESFREAVRVAEGAAAQGEIVTFGIRPSRPETGYGYIDADTGTPDSPVRKVRRFVEKPDLETAREYLAGGHYLWNAGIFLFAARTMIEELDALAPAILSPCRDAMKGAVQDGLFLRPSREEFASCPALSIDYAVMEKTGRASVVPLSLHWSDVGSWDALWELSPKDADGNAISGNVVAVETQSCLLRTETDATIAAFGIRDLAVVVTRDAVLVAPRKRSQDLNRLLKAFGESSGKLSAHAKVFRPWGSYEIMDGGERFQTKRLTVKPGGVLSLQLHHQRAEHWIVVSGTARVTIDGETRLLHENESTFVPKGTTHRLENPGEMPLEVVEVQCGDYLGEDDIVRLEDVYGRLE